MAASRPVESMTVPQLLDWINEMGKTQCRSVQDLSDGILYCKTIESLFPGVIDVKQMKTKTRFNSDKFHNLKLLQTALYRLGIAKDIPVMRIMKGFPQDCHNFLLWFRRFYITQRAAGHLDDFNTVKTEKPDKEKPIAVVSPTSFRKSEGTKRSLAKVAVKLTACIDWTNIDAAIDDDEPEPFGIRELQALYDEYESIIDMRKWDRNVAENKLLKIKYLLREFISKGQQISFCNWMLAKVEDESDLFFSAAGHVRNQNQSTEEVVNANATTANEVNSNEVPEN